MNLLGSVALIIAHDASFNRRFLERRLPVFTPLAVEMSPATLLPREAGCVPRYPKLILPNAGYRNRSLCRRQRGLAISGKALDIAPKGRSGGG